VTEREWLACTDPDTMLRYLRGKTSDRKLRLFAAAGFRRLVSLLPDPHQRRGIEVLEQLAEGTISRAGCRGVAVEVRRAIPPDDRADGMPPADDPHYVALMLYREFCSSSIAAHAVHAAAGLADGAWELHEQAELMRCIVGNPFSPAAVDPSCLAWHDGTVVKLAQAAYDQRDLPAGTLDAARLAVLADAVEEAGCTEADLLGHLRGPGPHCRGCWAIDLLLGK
jgi:hypothetical protein